MPKTLDKTYEGQVIAGTFTNRENTDQAVAAFEDSGISLENIEVFVPFDDEENEDVYTDLFTERRFSEYQANYYNMVIREGKVLVTVYGVTDPAPVIDIFDTLKAEYSPNGSHNLREDVLGLTAGAVVGAAVLGAIGAAVGGPVGAAVGGVAGAVVGGGSGAAAGKAAEHRK